MINHAIDHSGSESLRVDLRRNALHTEATLRDPGEGIHLKIQAAPGLDLRETILKWAKGKLTTNPENHFRRRFRSALRVLARWRCSRPPRRIVAIGSSRRSRFHVPPQAR